MIHHHHCRKYIGHQVVLFIEHIRLDDDRSAAIVRDAACDADRLSRLGGTDEIHRHSDRHDRGTDGGRGDARDRVGKRYQYAPCRRPLWLLCFKGSVFRLTVALPQWMSVIFIWK